MTNETERLQILEMIEKGVISAAEGVRLLNSLQGGDQEEPEEAATPLISPTAPTAAGPSPEPEVTVEEPSPEYQVYRLLHLNLMLRPVSGAAGGGSP